MDSYGLVEGGGPEVAEQRRRISRRFRVLAHRLERIRALSLPNELD